MSATRLIRKKLKCKSNTKKYIFFLLKNVANDFDNYNQCRNKLAKNQIITGTFEDNY